MNAPDLEKALPTGVAISDSKDANRGSMGTSVQPATIANVTGTTNLNPGAAIGFFGPGNPLFPIAPDDVEGRQWDFPTHYNLATQPRSYESVTFNQLRALADGYDLLRLIIETRKDQVESYDWEIRAKEGKDVPQATLDELNSFFEYPDQEHPWGTWIRMLLEDVFVIDAAVVYPRMTRGGKLYGIELMDGGTIKRVLDYSGRTPLPPDPAYQQVLKGLPAVDYTREELIYWMRNPRTNRAYGYSPVEQIMMTVNIAMRRQIHQLQFYTEGSMPEAIAGVPDSWNMDTLKQFQTWWDTMMEGNTAQRRHMKFVPFDPSKMAFPKESAMKDLFDEWLARICCFAFSISPTSLVKETNRATATSTQETALKEGLVPLLNWIKAFLDFLLQKTMGNTNAEFVWVLQKDLDPYVQAQCDQIYLSAKVLLPEEVRDRLGMGALTPEQDAKLNPVEPDKPQGKVDPFTGLPYTEPVPPSPPTPQPKAAAEPAPQAEK